MFREWEDIQSIIRESEPLFAHHPFELETLATLPLGPHQIPLHSFTFGSKSETAPVLGIIGGIHGLERIGTRVATAFLRYLVSRLSWDESLKWQLERIRIFIVPMVNPIGTLNFTRSNGNGVDLMRNAPLTSATSTWMLGGQSYSSKLPWYRGNPEQTFEGMEVESKTLIQHVRKQLARSRHAITLDLHSGFGLQDQIWFPYAKSKDYFPQLPEIYSLKTLLDRVHPHHIYRFEPQSKNYTTHGDLWDYLHETDLAQNPSRIFLPLTLEMGSWNWVKKNPIQLLSFLGAFNPIKPHRMKRTLRRHLPLFDHLIRSLVSEQAWSIPGPERAEIEQKARAEWQSPVDPS